MSSYLKQARHDAARINYFYENAGAAGYAQARYFESDLEDLLDRANKSVRGKDDVPLIQAIIVDVRPKLEEMKKREETQGAK